jgi:Zn2+/Cd2+-exporting ATPase
MNILQSLDEERHFVDINSTQEPFSLGIKLVALLLVIPGWLTLWIAIFADMGATLIVTLNGLRLLKIKDK